MNKKLLLLPFMLLLLVGVANAAVLLNHTFPTDTNMYVGAATLTWVNADNPHARMAFGGLSRPYNYSATQLAPTEISMVVNCTTLTASDSAIRWFTGDTSQFNNLNFDLRFCQGGNISYYYNGGASSATVTNVVANNSYFVSLRNIDYGTDDFDIYVNGVLKVAGAGMRSAAQNWFKYISVQRDTGADSSGWFDYDSLCMSDGGECPTNFTAAAAGGTPNITWVNPTPVNNTRNNTQVRINVSCSTADLARIYFNDSLVNLPGALVLNSTTTTLYTTSVITEKSYYYKAECVNTSTSTSSGNLSTKTWTYDVSTPTVTLNSNNFFNRTNASTTSHYTNWSRLNFTLADNLQLYGFEVNISKSGSKAQAYAFQNLTLSGTTYIYDKLLNMTNWTAGVYNINITVGDSHTAQSIPEYVVDKVSNGLRFVTSEGNDIRVVSDDASMTASRKAVDRYDLRFNFTDGTTKQRQFDLYSAEPITYLPNSPFKAHFVIWNRGRGNWVDFEGVTGSPNVVKVSDYHYKVIFTSVPDHVIFHSIGGLNVRTYRYKWYKGTWDLTEPVGLTRQDAVMRIQLTRNATRLTNVSGNLVYNNTAYQFNKTFYTGSFNLSSSILMPVVDGAKVLPYYWNLTFTGEGRQYKVLFNDTHTVSDFDINDSCGAGTYKTFNMTFFNEQVVSDKLVASAEYEISYWGGNKAYVKNFSNNLTSKNSYVLCISLQNVTLYGDLTIKYNTTGGFTHYYILKNTSFTNETTNGYLYNWITTTGVSTLLATLRDQSTFVPQANIIVQMQRKYVGEGVWRTVQMFETGTYGEAIFHILEETTDYRFLVSDSDNHLLRTTDSNIFYCSAGLCEKDLTFLPYTSSAADVTLNIQHLYFNDTNIINTTFDNPAGTTVNVQNLVIKLTGDGELILCNQTIQASSGTFSCNIGVQTGTILVRTGTKNSPIDIFKTTLFTVRGQILKTAMAASQLLHGDLVTAEQDGSFLTVMFMVTVVGTVGFISPVAAVISGFLALILAFMLGMVSILNMAFIIIVTALVLYLGVKLRQ